MNRPIASPAAQSVLGSKPALVSVLSELTVGTIFSCAPECSPSVTCSLKTSSLLLHEASRPAAITAERKKLVFIFI
nr:hypothetical protein [Bacteroides fragilis]